MTPEIVQHTIVLCVDKKDKALAIETLLNKLGFRVIPVSNIYEALKQISQEMPHLVIADSILSDGTAGTLYDRIMQHKTLNRTPIMVLIAKKTTEELLPLKGRRFAGFLLGQLDRASLLSKIKEILAHHHNNSPYFVPFTEESVNQSCTISVKAMVVGKSGDQVIYQSSSEVDAMATLVCVPDDKQKSPALLAMGSNVSKGDNVFNLFPLSRIRGKGRLWLETLPEINLDGDGEGGGKRRVLFFDPSVERANQFKEVLGGYDIELLHASSLQMAGAMLERDYAGLAAVYLDELPSAGAGIMFKDIYQKKVPAASRPPLVVGTTSLNTRSTADIRYLKKPFGLGVLVETLESAFKAGADIEKSIVEASGAANLDVTYQAPAKVLGVDETGGIFQVKFPLVKGTRLKLDHPLLEKIWGESSDVFVTSIAPLPNKPDVWCAKFQASLAEGNKAKYWEKVSQRLEELNLGNHAQAS